MMRHPAFSSPGNVAQRDIMGCLCELKRENEVLVRTLGAIQRRVTATSCAYAHEIESLRATVMRLRGELIARDTLVALLREELARLDAAPPPLQAGHEPGRSRA
jgi:predicted RNase H-like nuclease (RuvC/YqgF family)